jgi:hypothetical protein
LVQILLMLGWVLGGMPLRGTCSALNWMREMPVDWGFDFPVPHFTTVRFWLLRLGYHKLHRPKEQASDWVWIIDHSNQIGQEKCFVILGVRISQGSRWIAGWWPNRATSSLQSVLAAAPAADRPRTAARNRGIDRW